MTDTKPVHKRTTGGGAGLGAKAARRGPRAAMEQFLLAIGGGFRPIAIEADRLKLSGGRK